MANTIAVVIPMFNASKTIVRALNSLNSQTLVPDRVIVVDDGSTDNSFELVKAQVDKVSFSLDVIQQENAGPSQARNNGVECSKEELICFLDADDEWLESKLEKQLALYNELTNSGHQVGMVECFMKDISPVKHVVQDNPVLFGYQFEEFLERNAVKGTACVMLPRKVFSEVGGFDPQLRYSEDRLLWASIADKYEIFTLQEVLVNRYFGDEGNITSHPDKNYQHKMKFSQLFIDRFDHRLNEKQKTKIQLSSIYDFLTVFYSKGQYEQAISCYKDMLNASLSTLWYSNFYPTLKFIISLLKVSFKRKKVS